MVGLWPSRSNQPPYLAPTIHSKGGSFSSTRWTHQISKACSVNNLCKDKCRFWRMQSSTGTRLSVTVFVKGIRMILCYLYWALSVFIPANPAHVIIPILVTIFMVPVLVIITICCIRIRNIRARQRRIKDWAKGNRISRGMINMFEKTLNMN